MSWYVDARPAPGDQVGPVVQDDDPDPYDVLTGEDLPPLASQARAIEKAREQA